MVGYRDDGLYGDHETDPLEVCYYEVAVLGNLDIVDYLYDNATEIPIAMRDYLWEIAMEQHDEIDKWYFQDIITEYIGDRNFCLWLCDTPDNVYDAYLRPMSREDAMDRIEEYEIPEDAIILSDLGMEGKLYAWKEKNI